MNEWKKSYSKKNWAQKHDEEENDRREKILLAIIETNIEKLERNLSDREKLKILEKVNEAYNSLKREAFSYDEKEAEFVEKEMENLKWQILEKEGKRSPENESWEEYKEEEMKNEKEER